MGTPDQKRSAQTRFLKYFPNFMPISLLALLMFVLIKHFNDWITGSILAVNYPYQMDYAEGVIWQQALMILRGEGYSDISQLPYIVFHYPPVYHILTGLFADASNLSFLSAGRTISAIAALGSSCIVGVLLFTAVRSREALAPSIICALVGSLLLFSFNPVAIWSTLMRVDFLAIFLSIVGVYFGLRTPERPKLIYCSALFFVLALYTKQTTLSAPLSTLLVIWTVRPSLAVRGLISAFVLGSIGLCIMLIITDGGFLTHTVLYNINKFDFRWAFKLYHLIFNYNLFYILIVLSFLMTVTVKYINTKKSGNYRLKNIATKDMFHILNKFALFYIILTTLTLISVGKTGSNINYFLEAMFGWSIAISLMLRAPIVAALEKAGALQERADRRTDGLVGPYFRFNFPILFAVMLFQAIILPPTGAQGLIKELAGIDQQAELVKRVQNATKPVISDNMIAILQAGKEVLWESAIFNLLAAAGQWDERPFVQMIASKDFAFIILRGQQGAPIFVGRYSPAVLQAMRQTYPHRQEVAGYHFHLPQD